MPEKYIVLNNGKLIIELWQGVILHAELLEHEKRQLKDPSISCEAVGLADARLAQFPETTPELIKELVELYSVPGNVVKIRKYAFLVNTESWPQAKVFEEMAAAHGVTIITFVSLKVACTWLGIDLDETTQHLESLSF